MSSKHSDDKRQTYIATSHDVRLDKDYLSWVDEIAARYEQAGARATVRVNYLKLLWNWQMGRDLVMRRAEERWGAGVVEQLSFDLQNRYPGERGFGSRNLWNMKRWYLFYAEKLHQAGAGIEIRQLEELRKQLPTVEQLQERVRLLELELKNRAK